MGFPKDFMWGAASATYQVEGAYREDGKGPGIWDMASREPGHIAFGESGNIGCDHYHHFKEDVALMKEMGLKYYRFSISWPRVMPGGTGSVNEKGFDFYSALVDELIANGIEPLVTLFHWNYPYELQKKGGWLNDESPEWFAEYVGQVVDRLSDRVKYWITINEPQVFLGLGYGTGEFPPFCKASLTEQFQVVHHVLLAHGKAVQVIRSRAKVKPVIGMAPTGPCFTPRDNTPEALEEARRASFDFHKDSALFSNSLFGDPVFLGDYPDRAYEIFEDAPDIIKPGDLSLIAQPLDFYGVNIYESKAVKKEGTYPSNCYIGCPKTNMGWPIVPESLYYGPKFLYERYHKPILITENGMAGHDFVYLDGKVHDPYRIDFLNRYLLQLKKAVEDGVEVIGYMQWSVMDNFEWANGYDKRFGLIYVDYVTGERKLKDSAYWYKEVIKRNGENL